MNLFPLSQCCVHLDQLARCGCGALWLWAGGPRSSPSGYQCGSWRTLSDCGRGGGGWSWRDSHQFQRGEATHASSWQLLGWPARPYLCSIQHVIMSGVEVAVFFTDLAGTSDGCGNTRSWLTIGDDCCNAILFFSWISGKADWSEGKRWQREECLLLVLQDVSFTNKGKLTGTSKQEITKAFTVVLTFSSVVYICIFSNTVLGVYEGRVYLVNDL